VLLKELKSAVIVAVQKLQFLFLDRIAELVEVLDLVLYWIWFKMNLLKKMFSLSFMMMSVFMMISSILVPILGELK